MADADLLGGGEYHMDASYTSDQTIQMRSPVEMIPAFGNEDVVVLHNKNATHKFVVEDEDDNNIITLLTGEIVFTALFAQ